MVSLDKLVDSGFVDVHFYMGRSAGRSSHYFYGGAQSLLRLLCDAPSPCLHLSL